MLSRPYIPGLLALLLISPFGTAGFFGNCNIGDDECEHGNCFPDGDDDDDDDDDDDGGCDGDDDDDDDDDDGSCTTPPPPEYCLTGHVLLGPETFVRQTGPPTAELRSFLASQGNVCIIVENHATASATVAVDGTAVLAPSDFNPHKTTLYATHFVQTGTHELSVLLASAPNSSVDITVRGNGAPPRFCSDVATEWCEAKGWTAHHLTDGNIICTGTDAFGTPVEPECNCHPCSGYNIVVWADESDEKFCSEIHPPGYTPYTLRGTVYGGYEPCGCEFDLRVCGTWDPQGCVPD